MAILQSASMATSATPRSSEGFAVWYPVPKYSLAHRRGWGDEYTAAHNRLPIGTRVRVTRLSNGRSVVVRVTDRGIKNRRAKIDICREAAEKLDMIHDGFARVRMEILPEEAVATADQGAPTAH
jgi:rare lipoprotein A